MRSYRCYAARLVASIGLILLAAVAAGCTTGDPQNTLAPAGDVARKIRDLWNIVLWPLVGLFFVVEGLLLFALLRFRRRRDQELPRQVHGNTRLEIVWTIAPALFLLAIAIPTIITIADLAKPPPGDALAVEVTARQWSWSFRYPQLNITSPEPNEMYIPVGRTIKVRLLSTDVIHSFWVPKLAGKTDVMPAKKVDGKEVGRVNEMWFNATEPGTYSGQCAEFCGVGHWVMRFKVIALTEDEFQQWVKEQQAARPGSDAPNLAWQPEE